MITSLRLMPTIVLMLGIFLPRQAVAWHNEGHMAVAWIAWQQLSEAQQARSFTILQHHPHASAFLAEQRPESVPEPMWFFVKAATWPDWVKNPVGPGITPQKAAEIKHLFNKSSRHFVNLPFVHPDEAAQFDVAKIRKDSLEPEFDEQAEPRHALAALKQALQLLEAASTSDKDKAVSLCWILHLVGDLHQPLHSSALLASSGKVGPEEFQPPHGDMGGNRCAVQVNENDNDAIELHAYWDGLQFSSRPPFSEMQTQLPRWLADPKLQRNQFAELAQTEFLVWADEASSIVASQVYRDRGAFLQFIPLSTDHKSSDLIGLKAPFLSQSYKDNAEAIAQRRMVLAGYRLADRLSATLGTQ